MTIRQPLLAAKTTDADLQRLSYPVLASPKIDGIRATVVNGVLMSRSMKPIRNLNTQLAFGRPEFEGLDGELVVGNAWDPNLMQQTSSGVMSIAGKPNAKFYVFDKWNLSDGYYSRYDAVRKIIQGLDPGLYGRVIPWLHNEIFSYEELMKYEEKCLMQGYEGVMLRSFNGRYKEGRSTLREGILLKVKRFQDDEAIVIDYEPLYRNENTATTDERGYTKRSHATDGKVADEMLGSLTVRILGGDVTFNIGSGFTEAQRVDLWDKRNTLKGRIVKFKHFAVTGVKDKPRIAIFLGFRDVEDM